MFDIKNIRTDDLYAPVSFCGGGDGGGGGGGFSANMPGRSRGRDHQSALGIGGWEKGPGVGPMAQVGAPPASRCTLGIVGGVAAGAAQGAYRGGLGGAVFGAVTGGIGGAIGGCFGGK
jgi:hypothetical protein